MTTDDHLSTAPRDPASISPSAYALLAMKGHTSIPFAREAAALLENYGQFTPDLADKPEEYWNRILHFESRYWSIDQLLGDQPATNILELSSGFSFRGLALSRNLPVYYIDTDLPGVIEGKQRFVNALTAGETSQTAGHYELQPLNVLDGPAFQTLVQRFPPGPVSIVNEGLLVYLDATEKEQLCQTIRKILLARGGCWITADIYIKKPEGDPLENTSASFRQWSEQHKIEEKKFGSFQLARDFFERMGFTVEKEAKPDYSRLTALTHLAKNAGPDAIERLRQPGRTRLHATWRLVART